MNKHDYLGLDGYTLRTFITVLEEASVSKAALRLGVSQSAISHTLDRLRLAFDDALFVRDGRGIIPTAKVASLREPIESIINNIKSLTVTIGTIGVRVKTLNVCFIKYYQYLLSMYQCRLCGGYPPLLLLHQCRLRK